VFVCDVVKEEFPTEIKQIDFATLLFVLSAISPLDMPSVIEKIFKVCVWVVFFCYCCYYYCYLLLSF